MNITKTIPMDLGAWDAVGPVAAVEGDKGSRAVRLEILDQGTAWVIPEGVTATVVYDRENGTAGTYETLENGNQACTLEGNTILVELSPQMLSSPGRVFAAVKLRDNDGHQLTTFSFLVDVKSMPGQGWISTGEASESLQQAVENLTLRVDALEKTGQVDLDQLAQAVAEQFTNVGKEGA